MKRAIDVEIENPPRENHGIVGGFEVFDHYGFGTNLADGGQQNFRFGGVDRDPHSLEVHS